LYRLCFQLLGHKVAGATPVATMARQDASQKFQVTPVACGAAVLQSLDLVLCTSRTPIVRLPFSSNYFRQPLS